MKLEIKTAFLCMIMIFFHESKLLIKCVTGKKINNHFNKREERKKMSERFANNWQTVSIIE